MARRTKSEDPVAVGQGDGTDESADGNSTVSAISDTAKQAASQAKDAASNMLDQAKDQAASRIDQQRQTLASGIQAVANAFRSMGEDLRNKEEGPVAQYGAEIGQAIGGQVERLGSYLQGRDIHQLITEAEDFARRSPAVFLGSAFVLGLAASRFLKSSRPAASSRSNGGQVGSAKPQLALPPAQPPAYNANAMATTAAGIPDAQSTLSSQSSSPATGYSDPTVGV